MRIADITIRNFRKLKEVCIDLRDNTTVFIGANNSGKTSAVTAMRYFLDPEENKNFDIHDFTLSNHTRMREIGERIVNESSGQLEQHDLSAWVAILPSLDLWFDVGNDDIHYVSHILPTLDWAGGNLGVRLQYEPKDIENFHSAYKEARTRAMILKERAIGNGKSCSADLFPKDMIDFLKEDIEKYFCVKFYLLDPEKKETEQETIEDPIEGNPLNGLICIHKINAQRGLNDEVEDASSHARRPLSLRLAEYYNQHLDPLKDPTDQDIEAIDAIHQARNTFAKSMRQGFEPALDELKTLGYPGFYNPSITINPLLRPTDGLDHSSALQYELDGCREACLPEMYNGLGYQNLILIAFRLMQYRDSWLKVGKLKTSKPNETSIEYSPIHLVLVEEPEAHLHPQAQQVFIKQAYKILTNRDEIKIGKLTTQLIITTHSSHMTHECEFSNLRYFKRILPTKKGDIHSSRVVNLSNVFGKDDDTKKFVSRYIKLAHCDLFFADAAILIEGDAERILLPHFLRRFKYLNQSYISLLSIGGSHAHRLRPFMESLEIPTVIITDLDATSSDEDNSKKKSVPVKRGASQQTNNDTLKSWYPEKTAIDDLLGLPMSEKTKKIPFPLAVVFQIPISFNGREVLPYTFEDSLIFENKAIFDTIDNAKGMLKKAKDITDAKTAFEVIRDSSFKKAEFALDLLYLPNFDDMQVPTYISDGLQWLETILTSKLTPVLSVEDDMGVDDGK